ncbi:MAG: hypothetical protein ACRDRE_16970, partial [Pseudonocardiaceae bacterium]
IAARLVLRVLDIDDRNRVSAQLPDQIGLHLIFVIAASKIWFSGTSMVKSSYRISIGMTRP